MSIKEAALELAEDNGAADESITDIFWFPDKEVVQLLEVCTDFPPQERAQAFYFRAPDGMDYPVGVGLIAPGEERAIPPPEGWVAWENAELIWQRQNGS